MNLDVRMIQQIDIESNLSNKLRGVQRFTFCYHSKDLTKLATLSFKRLAILHDLKASYSGAAACAVRALGLGKTTIAVRIKVRMRSCRSYPLQHRCHMMH